MQSDSAQVTLITDHASAVSAKVLPGGVQGVIRPDVGDPEDLVLDFIDSTKRVDVGQTVATSGWRAQGLASLFPPGMPVGEVVRRLDTSSRRRASRSTCDHTPTSPTSTSCRC